MPSVSTGKSYYKNISSSQIISSCQVLSTFVPKFTRRCVTYLAKDGLAPQHEEDESAIRQMLKTIKQKQERHLQNNTGSHKN